MATAATETKASYKVRNWAKYNVSLVKRRDITLWFDEDLLDAWEHDNADWKVGRPYTYSDLAIESLLMLRELFRPAVPPDRAPWPGLSQADGRRRPVSHFTLLQKHAGQRGGSRLDTIVEVWRRLPCISSNGALAMD